MVLATDVSELLEQMAAENAPPLETLPPVEARQAYLEMREMFGEPEPVGEVIDRKIPGPGGEIPLRIYKPMGEGPFPILVYFHGGGFVIGDIETHDPLCRLLTNAVGCITVSVDYRLAPEHPFPAAVEDAYAATEWTAKNAQTLGGDKDRLAVGGDSAGGNLSAVVALMARDKGGPSLVYQVLIYPCTDCTMDTPSHIDNAEGYLLTRDMMAWFWSNYIENEGERKNPLVSPLRADDLSGLPPALVITAEFDPLRDEGEAYASRLKDAGVAVEATRYDGMIHGFFQMTAVVGQATKAQEDVAGRLQAAFAE